MPDADGAPHTPAGLRTHGRRCPAMCAKARRCVRAGSSRRDRPIRPEENLGQRILIAVDLPEIFHRRTLRLEGFADDEVRRLLRAGRLTAVRRGAYVLGAPPENREARHALRVRAQLAHLADDAVVSHASAAVLHGLPTWGMRLDRVHVTRARRTGGRSGRQVHVHTAPLATQDLDVADGVPVTSVARTVVDLARTLPFEAAVAVADVALHSLITEPELLVALQAALADALARSTGWRGSPEARRVLAFADARSGSVGESRSRVAIQRAGLPPPVLQWEVIGSAGQWIGCRPGFELTTDRGCAVRPDLPVRQGTRSRKRPRWPARRRARSGAGRVPRRRGTGRAMRARPSPRR